MSRAVLGSGLVAGLLLLLLACSALSVHTLNGMWGSAQAQFQASSVGATFQVGCTQIVVKDGITPDSANHFEVSASYSFLPVSLDPPGAARLIGDLTGDSIILSVRFTDTNQRMGPLALKRDFPASLPTCQ